MLNTFMRRQLLSSVKYNTKSKKIKGSLTLTKELTGLYLYSLYCASFEKDQSLA